MPKGLICYNPVARHAIPIISSGFNELPLIIERTKKFSLNVLRSDQKELAAVFFKPQKALGGRFESVEFNLKRKTSL